MRLEYGRVLMLRSVFKAPPALCSNVDCGLSIVIIRGTNNNIENTFLSKTLNFRRKNLYNT